jgi:hypothetical protein
MRRERDQARAEAQKRDAWVAQNYGHLGIQNFEQYTQALEQQKAQQEVNAFDGETEATVRQMEEAGYDRFQITMFKQQRATEKRLLQMEQTEQQRLAAVERQKKDEAVAKAAEQIEADHKRLSEKFGDAVPALDALDADTVNKVKRGYSLYDAWVSSNLDKVAASTAKKAAEAAKKNTASKAHVRGDNGTAGGDDVDTTTIPRDVYKTYKAMNPKWTDKQIVADYKKHNK